MDSHHLAVFPPKYSFSNCEMATGGGVGGSGESTSLNLYISIALAAWTNLGRFLKLIC